MCPASHCMLPCCIPLNSLDAFGVDIAPFSAMPHEQEVLLLPCMPLTTGPGENPEPDLWTFNVESPDSHDPPPVMIDYVHPGEYNLSLRQYEHVHFQIHSS